MWALIVPLIAQLLGEKGPLGQYFKTKADAVIAENNYKLKALEAQSQRDTAEFVADTTQRANYLEATSRGFRQGIFYWFSAIILFSILCPDRAEAMWANFDRIPQWIQYAYLGMICVAWGLPTAKEHVGLMFASIGRGLAASREYKLQKINRKAVFNALKAKWFPKGMNQQAVEILDGALDEGEK